jgi:hypothetical protein
MAHKADAVDLSQLPTLSEVPPFSSDDEACISDLVEVLRKHNRLDRFGLTLLHQHFQVGSDEVLVEECDPARKTLTTKPVKKTALDSVDFRETSWRLDTGRAVMHCVCINFPGTGGHSHYHQK